MRRVVLGLAGPPASGSDATPAQAGNSDAGVEKPRPDSQQAGSGEVEVSVKYSGFTLAWKGIAADDYLILVDDKNIKTVLQIIRTNDQNVTCKILGHQTDDADKSALDSWKPGASYPGYAIKAFNPLDYMAGMFAIYMFHALFYASSMKGVTDFDNLVSTHAINFPVGDKLRLPSDFIGSRVRPKRGILSRGNISALSETDQAKLHSCALACWLMLGGYRHGGSNDEARALVTAEISKWLSATLAAVFGVPATVSQIDYARNAPISDAVIAELRPQLSWTGVSADAWREMVKSYLEPEK